MLDRRMRPNTVVLCCFSLLVCLSVWQLITGPGPPTPSYLLEVSTPPSQFAANWISDANVTYEYPLNVLLPDDYHQLIDMNNFNFTIMNNACNETSPLLLILIHSDPKNVHRRKVIRETWGQKMDNVVLLFVLGEMDRKLQAKLNAENETFADFVQGNFVDSYENVTYKHAMVFKYAIYHCPSAKYILKTDDDVFVNLITLKDFLHEELSPHGGKDLMFCNLREKPVVNRSYRSKWRVKFSEYRENYYPDMCPGWSVLYSPDVLFKIYVELQKSSYFWIDDVVITGVLREKANITLSNNKDWVMSKKALDSLHEWNESKPYLYGPADLKAAQIRQLWNYTLHHVHSKQFHYTFAQTQQHNHNLNATSSLVT
ncbi:beta-1,3-galactosyltransferase 5 isoform X2 [Atheta coriaria]